MAKQLETPQPTALARALEEEEMAGLLLALRARSWALAAFAGLVLVLQPLPYSLLNAGYLGVMWLLGQALTRLVDWRDTAWPAYLLAALDTMLLCGFLFVFNPLIWDGLRPEMLYSYAAAPLFMVLLSVAMLTYSVRLVLWSGLVAALTWIAIYVWIATDPSAALWMLHVRLGGAPLPEDWRGTELLLKASIPRVVELSLFLLLAGILATAVQRNRRLVRRQAEAARERANLARYFSPNMVEELAHSDQVLGAVRSQSAAVLFCDVIGFTRIAEPLSPAETIDLLRGLHGRISAVVFEHGGTVSKYMGDAMMASFGMPQPGAHDAASAVVCARAINAELARWNLERKAAGQTAVHAGVGAHWGEVVSGDIGSEAVLEYAVIGDTVNVASRLEGLTRELGADIVISAELAEEARRQGAADALAGFEAAAPQRLRNRDQPVDVLVLRTGRTAGRGAGGTGESGDE